MFSFLLGAGAIVLALFVILRWLLLAAGRGSTPSPFSAGVAHAGGRACPYCGSHRVRVHQIGLGIAHVCTSCRREVPHP